MEVFALSSFVCQSSGRGLGRLGLGRLGLGRLERVGLRSARDPDGSRDGIVALADGLALGLGRLVGGGGHVGEADGLDPVAGVPLAASGGGVVVGVAHGRDGRTEGEDPLEGLAAEDLGDFAGPLGAHPVPQAPVAVVVPVRLVEVLEGGVAAPVDEVVAEHGGDAGEGVEDLEAAALLALEILDAALAVGGDLADGGILAGEGVVVGRELPEDGLGKSKAG